MKIKLTLAALSSALLAVSLQAGIIDLSFEGLQDQEQVLNYYNGGYGGSGSGPGPSDGITFGTSSLALIQGNAGGSGNFGGESSADTVLFFSEGTGAVMDVAAGFTDGFSFYYSAAFESGSVSVYSGLDDTGDLLATLTLPVTPNTDSGGDGNCDEYGTASNPGANFCPFVAQGVTFAGTAMSVDFGGSAGQIAFDDVTLGSDTPGSAPEPGTIFLLGSGLLGVALSTRKFRTKKY